MKIWRILVIGLLFVSSPGAQGQTPAESDYLWVAFSAVLERVDELSAEADLEPRRQLWVDMDSFLDKGMGPNARGMVNRALGKLDRPAIHANVQSVLKCDERPLSLPRKCEVRDSGVALSLENVDKLDRDTVSLTLVARIPTPWNFQAGACPLKYHIQLQNNPESGWIVSSMVRINRC